QRAAHDPAAKLRGICVVRRVHLHQGPRVAKATMRTGSDACANAAFSDPDGRTTINASMIAIDPTTQVRAAGESSFPFPPQSTAPLPLRGVGLSVAAMRPPVGEAIRPDWTGWRRPLRTNLRA